ncbi:MAG TPA: ROK family protein [Cyclobacteriaceae bacterium]
MQPPEAHERILAIDIGGSRIKATILAPDGNMLMEYDKIETPASGKPADIIQAILTLTKSFEPYDKISVGFPGYVKGGIVHTAPNLGTEKWAGVEFAKLLVEKMQKPLRLLNDADLQGLGVVSGQGLEIVITLGTGFGTAILIDGNLIPHFEIAHHPIKKNVDYDAYVGNHAREDIGDERWNKRIRKVIEILKTVFNYDRLYISGGNSRKLNFSLEDNIIIASNRLGIRGGAKLWHKEDNYSVTSFYPKTV